MRHFLSQTLHIFRKDARGLWPQITWCLGATAVFEVCGILRADYAHDALLGPVMPVLTVLLLVSWCSLTGLLVGAEPLLGDRHFWRTRPYSWRCLLASKLLAVVVWILLPKLLADMAVLATHGFSPLAHLSGLLLSALVVLLFYLIPVMFLAAVSPSPMLFLTVVCVTIPGLFVWNHFLASIFGLYDTAPPSWAADFAALVGISICLGALLVWQYARRRTVWVVSLAVAALVLCPLAAQRAFTWTRQFEMQRRLTPLHLAPGSLHFAVDPDDPTYQCPIPLSDRLLQVRIPIRISGAPAGVTPVLQGASFSLHTSSGDLAAGDGLPWQNVGFRSSVGTRPPAELQFRLDHEKWSRVALQPFSVRGTAYIALYGNPLGAQIREFGRPVNLGDVARCALYASKPELRMTPLLRCEWPIGLRAGEFISTLRIPLLGLSGPDAPAPARLVERLSKAPVAESTPFDLLPATGNLSPLAEFSQYRLLESDTQPVVGFQELLGFVKTNFELPAVLLADTWYATGMFNGDATMRRVAATVSGSLPPAPAGRSGLMVVLISEHARESRSGLAGFVDFDGGTTPGGYRSYAAYPGVYYIVAGPPDILNLNSMEKDMARFMAAGTRVELRRGDNITVNVEKLVH